MSPAERGRPPRELGRYFAPPYLGPKGWVGIRLNNNPDWTLVQSLIEDSYRLTAPKRLAAQVES